MRRNFAAVNAGTISTPHIPKIPLKKREFDVFHRFVVCPADTLARRGYPGMVMLAPRESSFFPFPGKVAIPPAARLTAAGRMNPMEMNFSTVILGGGRSAFYGRRWRTPSSRTPRLAR